MNTNSIRIFILNKYKYYSHWKFLTNTNTIRDMNYLNNYNNMKRVCLTPEDVSEEVLYFINGEDEDSNTDEK